MKRDLNQPIPELKLQEEFSFSFWKMQSASEEQHYLDLETEIWPDTPLGMNRLAEYKSKKRWTSMVVRQSDTIVGGLMAWQEEQGVIEDVFVRESWRKRGIAQFLLTQALTYLKENHLQDASLMVLTSNDSALSLYESVGCSVDKEEIRYYKILGRV